VTWIERYGLHANQVGNLYWYGAICCALSSGLLIHPVLQRFSSINVLYVALIALLFSILPCLWHVRRELLWGLIPLQQYFLALLYSTGAATVSNKVPSDQQGEVMGIMQSVETIAFSSTPLLGGVFVSMSYNMPSFIGSAAMLLSSLILFRGSRTKLPDSLSAKHTPKTQESKISTSEPLSSSKKAAHF
jgi:MFS transporter, DHA1 family, tetracycline resistance protein